jgi:hypothetical protein
MAGIDPTTRIVRREGALTALVDEELDFRLSRRMSRIGVTYGAICVGLSIQIGQTSPDR